MWREDAYHFPFCFKLFGNRHRGDLIFISSLKPARNSSHDKLSSRSVGSSQPIFFLRSHYSSIPPGSNRGEEGFGEKFKLVTDDRISLRVAGWDRMFSSRVTSCVSAFHYAVRVRQIGVGYTSSRLVFSVRLFAKMTLKTRESLESIF